MPIGLKGNSDGSGAIQIGGSDAISISTGLNTTFAGTVTASGGVMYPLTSGTAVASTSGTAIDFTGIPSWAKRITVMFSEVSTNGTSQQMIQLGDAGGVETTGYVTYTAAITNSAVATTAYTNGWQNFQANATRIFNGTFTLNLLNSATNTWVGTWLLGNDTPSVQFSSGTKALSDTLTQVRITTVNGTDTFDAGSINILYE